MVYWFIEWGLFFVIYWNISLHWKHGIYGLTSDFQIHCSRCQIWKKWFFFICKLLIYRNKILKSYEWFLKDSRGMWNNFNAILKINFGHVCIILGQHNFNHWIWHGFALLKFTMTIHIILLVMFCLEQPCVFTSTYQQSLKKYCKTIYKHRCIA